MHKKDIASLLKTLESSWKKVTRLDRIKVESTYGVDLIDENKELCDRIHTALLHDSYIKQINKIPLGLWVAYLSMVSGQRFISTLWLLTERIPGFIHKLTVFCEKDNAEHCQFVLNRFAKICRRALYEEALSPSNINDVLAESK